MLNNQPLCVEYHCYDVVSVRGGFVQALLYRPYAVRLGFLYQGVDSEEEDLKRREAIFAAFPARPESVPSFFWKGMGFLLLRREDQIPVAVQAFQALPFALELVRLSEKADPIILWANP